MAWEHPDTSDDGEQGAAMEAQFDDVTYDIQAEETNDEVIFNIGESIYNNQGRDGWQKRAVDDYKIMQLRGWTDEDIKNEIGKFAWNHSMFDNDGEEEAQAMKEDYEHFVDNYIKKEGKKIKKALDYLLQK